MPRRYADKKISNDLQPNAGLGKCPREAHIQSNLPCHPESPNAGRDFQCGDDRCGCGFAGPKGQPQASPGQSEVRAPPWVSHKKGPSPEVGATRTACDKLPLSLAAQRAGAWATNSGVKDLRGGGRDKGEWTGKQYPLGPRRTIKQPQPSARKSHSLIPEQNGPAEVSTNAKPNTECVIPQPPVLRRKIRARQF